MTEPEQPVVAVPLRAALEHIWRARMAVSHALQNGPDKGELLDLLVEALAEIDKANEAAALAVEAVRPLDGGLVGALANMQDFVDHGKATLDAEDVANLKALLALDISLIGAAIKRNLGLAVEAVRPETIDEERLARALADHYGPRLNFPGSFGSDARAIIAAYHRPPR